MYKGKPLKVFVTTEEVNIKKEKLEKVKPPVAQLSEKEDKDTESDKCDTDLSQGSSAGQGDNRLIEMMNKLTPDPSVSATETSGSKNEMKVMDRIVIKETM